MINSFSAPQTLSPNQLSTVSVVLKNIGSRAWNPDGAAFVSLYHWNPVTKREKASDLRTTLWETPSRPIKVSKIVVPGQEYLFSFPIQAPSNSGTYHANFILAAEDVAWIPNSRFSFDVKVSGSPVAVPSFSVVTPSSSASSLGTSSDWSAELVDRGGSEWQIEMEDHVIVNLAFKNTGTRTWTRDGPSFVSLYATDGSKERRSSFKDFHWLSPTRAVRLKETSVKPGGIGQLVLELRAPRVPGAYQEQFTLAAENTAWIKGSAVTLPIRVPMTAEFIATASPGQDLVTPMSSVQNTSTLSAVLLLRSFSSLVLAADQKQEVILGFKNISQTAWSSRSLQVRGMNAATQSSAVGRDGSWVSSLEPVRVSGPVKPGEIAFLAFTIQAPSSKGSYTARFQLYADNEPVKGGEVDIPLTVTSDGVFISAPPNASGAIETSPLPLNGNIASLPSEPLIRVGLFKTTDNQMVVRASSVALSIVQGGSALCRVPLGQTVTIRFDRSSRVYQLSGACVGQSTDPFVVRADDGISPMEIADFLRPVSWLPGANDNTFRAQLELRFAPATNNVWIINELPIEYYLRGIAETSDQSPFEYQKALLTAARTYAKYHLDRGTKHAAEFFTVDATYDQVYRGYGAEARSPQITSAVQSTKGQVVAHEGSLAVTPYYSRSDGRTRAWTEVWAGSSIPWLVSVPVPWDQGKTLWGHGVGMSATGALGMANEGKKYDEILRYFYTGTDLRKAYQ